MENEVHRPVLDDVEFSRISEEDPIWLDRPFDEDEVFEVINSFDPDKLPSSDDFSQWLFIFFVLLVHFEIIYYECISYFSCSSCVRKES